MEQALSDRPYTGYSGYVEHNEAHSSGVSWAAVIAGAAVTAALSLILLALGAGLGLSSVSPYSNTGISASTLGTSAIIWLIVMEILSASMGGYLAGRLRTKWASIHTDEVYFRDTAHGFLAWSTALVITAAFLASAASAMIGSAPASESQINTTQLERAPRSKRVLRRQPLPIRRLKTRADEWSFANRSRHHLRQWTSPRRTTRGRQILLGSTGVGPDRARPISGGQAGVRHLRQRPTACRGSS